MFCDQLQIPVAHGGEDGDGLRGRDARISGGPFFLVEGLDDVVVFGKRLAQAKGKGDFAVGEVADDFGGDHLPGAGGLADFLRADGFEQGWMADGVVARIVSSGRPSRNFS